MITLPQTIINDCDTSMCTANVTHNVNINILIIGILKKYTYYKRTFHPSTIQLNI